MQTRKSLEKLLHKLSCTTVAFDEESGFSVSITNNSGIEWNKNELRQAIKELIVLEVIKRIVKDNENWHNADFGAKRNKLYIDGCAEYLSENEKRIVKEWLSND